MWFVKNKNVTMLHNLLKNWPVMMEASSLQVFTSHRRKVRLMTLIKLVKLFVLWSESDPLLYRWCCLSNPIKKKLLQVFQYSIDVVAVNYAVFAINIFINYYLWCTCILCQILQKKGKYLSEVSVINKN